MTRLLIVTTVDRTMTAFLLPFADYFRARGWTVDAMTAGLSAVPECASRFDRVWEMEWTRRLASRANLAAANRVREIVGAHAYDLVHVHTPVAGFITRLALRQMRQASRPKVVYTAHGFHCHPQGKRTTNAAFCTLEKLAGSWTDALVVINHEDERLARRLGLAKNGRIYYMPGIGIDLERYSRATVDSEAIASAKEAIGLGPRDGLFLMVAAFDPEKRHADAVRALHAVGERGVHLAFAGLGPELEAVRALSESLGLSDRVHFLGSRSDIPILLAAADALLLPSGREGLPRSILEAMAMKTPVIGSYVRGTTELLGGDAGLLVKIGDVNGLAEAMRSVLREPEEAQAMAERAHRRVGRYSLSRVLALHAEMYEDLLGS
ncbi:MAG: hypothetical protein A2133_09445 [Actinobacteria bacterium RBG_16_64_13]|nr:MAG: hypothetical protein A2133_09445 [Actinobacteria bacterium RBG_16_64_13]